MGHTVIALSRQYGSGGREIGRQLAHRLGIAFYDKEIIELAAGRGDIELSRLEGADENRSHPWLFESVYEGGGPAGRGTSPSDALYWLQSEIIRKKAREEDCLLVGRCANHVLARAGIPHISIYICAPLEKRIQQVGLLEHVDEKEAAALVRKTDKQRRAYYEQYTGRSWGAPENYDLCINSARYGVERTVDLLVRYCHQVD